MSSTYKVISLFFLLLLASYAPRIFAAIEVSVGDVITIGEFVYDDDYVATTTPCTVSVYDPTNTLKVNAASMLSNPNGWHYYDYTVPLDGVSGLWPSFMTCGHALNGDLIKGDKSFLVRARPATQADVISASTSITNALGGTNTRIENASSSIVTSLPGLIWSYSARTLSSFGTLVTDSTASVWSAGTRTLTTFGTLATEVWSATTRTLTSLTLSSQTPWTVSVSNFGSITAEDTYRATVTTVYNGTLTDSQNVPTVTIYDPNRNVIVSGAAMTRTATGTYEYAYVTAPSAPAGVWESVFSATVETGKVLPGNDYWEVVTNPAQVIINSVNATTVPNVSANVTITNEGSGGYEYQYEWCVVSTANNTCGGGDDVYHATAAKFILPGEDFNTNLSATVPTAGNYYFKLVVYFGTEKSGSSRTFSVAAAPSSGGGGSSSGGGGGGGGGGGTTIVRTAPVGSCKGADFNGDNKVNSVDFSILLAFWKTKPPFKNTCVDINKDSQVSSTDFSIMLSQWGTQGRKI